jgi:hypothetical protein
MSDAGMAYVRPDGVTVIRGSSLGYCSRALWASLSGVDPEPHSENTKRIFAEGDLHEAAIKESLALDGIEIVDDQEEVELWVIPQKLVIVGHLDGRVKGIPNRIFEAKSMSRAAFDKWMDGKFAARPEYAWQISAYMYGSGARDALYAVKRRDDGFLDTFVIQKPPIPLREIKAKAMKVFKAFGLGDMPECDPERFPCQYWFLHDEAPDSDLLPPSGITAIQLDSLAAEYLTVKSVLADMEEKKNELRNRIASIIKAGGEAHEGEPIKSETDEYKFSVHKQKGAERFDKARARAELGDEVFGRFITTGEPFDVLRVTAKEKD